MWLAGMVQHATAQDMPDGIAFQQAHYANTAGYSKLWNCIAGSNMSPCPPALAWSFIHAGMVFDPCRHRCLPYLCTTQRCCTAGSCCLSHHSLQVSNSTL